MGLSTHILDTARGRPAADVAVTLERRGPTHAWIPAGGGTTNADGRVKSLLPDGAELTAGEYRVTFAVGAYFAGQGLDPFFPEVQIALVVRSVSEHYHVPLLLSPFGYSTYRGS